MNPLTQFRKTPVLPLLIALAFVAFASPAVALEENNLNQVLEWNQSFVDTLIATNTPNSSSQRLGAIVHTASFDAYNGIERRYTPVFVPQSAPSGASRRAAVIAAAHRSLVVLFPSQQPSLDASYAASLAALSDDGEDGGQSRERGIIWGTQVAQAVLAWRSGDGFDVVYPPFTGGTAIGQWRPIPPATAMSAPALAFTATFVLLSNSQFRPPPPRSLISNTYTNDFNTVKALGRQTGSTRTEEQTALAPFWEGNASVHWNQAANQIARANHLSISDSNRLLAVLNIAMADAAFTIWSAKRFYGSVPAEVTWRPATSIPWRTATATPPRIQIRTGSRSSRRLRTPNTLPGTLPRTGSLRRYSSAISTTHRRLRSQPDRQTASTPASGKHVRTGTTPGSGAACTIRARS
jgi:hypothetical protein